MEKMNICQKRAISQKGILILVAMILTVVTFAIFAIYNSFLSHKALAESALAYKVEMNKRCEHYKKKAPEPQQLSLHKDYFSCDAYLVSLPVGSTIAEERIKAKAAGLTIAEGN